MKIDEFDNKKLKAFLTLLRRASKCRYSSVVMVNRVLIQCYNIDIDSDIGMHYTLFIPDTTDYDSPFYQLMVELTPGAILKTYTVGHKKLLEIKKERGLKPKDVDETLHIATKEINGFDVLEFKFQYIVDGMIQFTESYHSLYPLDTSKPGIENCVSTLDSLASRIKPGGYCVQLDALRLGIFQRALNCSDIYYHIIKLNETKIRIPFMKSMFLGAKRFDIFVVTIQETVIPGIYVYCMLFHREGISECFYGYIQNY